MKTCVLMTIFATVGWVLVYREWFAFTAFATFTSFFAGVHWIKEWKEAVRRDEAIERELDAIRTHEIGERT